MRGARLTEPGARVTLRFPWRSSRTRRNSPRSSSGLLNTSDTRLRHAPSDKAGVKSTSGKHLPGRASDWHSRSKKRSRTTRQCRAPDRATGQGDPLARGGTAGLDLAPGARVTASAPKGMRPVSPKGIGDLHFSFPRIAIRGSMQQCRDGILTKR